jgi:hypothetical protein
MVWLKDLLYLINSSDSLTLEGSSVMYFYSKGDPPNMQNCEVPAKMSEIPTILIGH